MRTFTLCVAALLAFAARSEERGWFNVSFADYLQGQSLSAAGAAGGAWETPLPANATNVYDGVRNGIALHALWSGSVLFEADPSAEVLSTLGFRPFAGSKRFDVASPATVLFSNAIGGRVLTVQYHPAMSKYQMFSEARRAWLLAALDRLFGEKTFASGHDQDMLVLVRRNATGGRIVLAENLNPDPIRHLSFRMASEPREVQRLAGDGTWRTVNAKFDGGKIVCDTTLDFYEAAVLRFAMGQPSH